jgi:outer membrane protein assembly factor BamA
MRHTLTLLLTWPLLTLFNLTAKSQMGIALGTLIYSTGEEAPVNDSTALYTIKNIVIEGNNKTRDKIILRELSFGKNEQYPLNELVDKINRAKKQLLNTALFQEVVVSLQNTVDQDATVLISVKERWYVYPMPFVDVVDRSMQEWIKSYDMDLNRVNYGVRITHKNLMGLNDRFYLNLTNGYSKQVTANYNGIFLDKKLQWSSNVKVSYGKRREVTYANIGHRTLTYKNEDRFVHTYFRSSVEVSYRKAIRSTHTFGLGYQNDNISDTIFKMSADYSSQQRRLSYPEVFYRWNYANADFIPYPTKGFISDLTLQKKGFSPEMNLWQATVRTSASMPVSPKYFFNLRTTGIIKLPFEQPYITQGFVGADGMYIQGYEDYVIDGVAGGFSKLTFTRELFNTAISIPSQRIKRLNRVPIKAYAKVFGNAGYIYQKNPHPLNQLNNRLLYSGGIGVDVVLFYDLTFRFEWSLNHLGQNGLYLHDRRYL